MTYGPYYRYDLFSPVGEKGRKPWFDNVMKVNTVLARAPFIESTGNSSLPPLLQMSLGVKRPSENGTIMTVLLFRFYGKPDNSIDDKSF